jgi:hypothetical protein
VGVTARPKSIFTPAPLPKSPDSEWEPFLSKHPLDMHDLEAVARALDLPLDGAWCLILRRHPLQLAA